MNLCKVWPCGNILAKDTATLKYKNQFMLTKLILYKLASRALQDALIF